MFIGDLFPMPNRTGRYARECVAIGWLDAGQQFSTGPTSSRFQRQLREVCRNPVWLFMGTHACQFCSQNASRGNGEIHVQGLQGELFVGPTLISHYVDVHSYRPPDQFMEAVEAMVVYNPTLDELSSQIFHLLKKPTQENRDTFYGLFRRSRPGIRVGPEFGTILPGEYLTA